MTRELPCRRERRNVGPTEVVESEGRIDLGEAKSSHFTGPGICSVISSAISLSCPFHLGTAHTVFRQRGASLRALEQLPGITTIVPGHGGVLRSWDYVRLQREAIDSLMAQADAAVAEGLTFEQTRRGW
jgi:hypothetical protein